jgi:hypothetical protein
MEEVTKFSVFLNGSNERTTYRIVEEHNVYRIQEYLPNTRKWVSAYSDELWFSNMDAVLSSSYFQRLFLN